MGVLSRNHVSEPVPRISQQPHGVLATLIRLPWLWAILLLASAVRFYGSTASAIWCDEGSSLLLSQFSLAGIWLHAARDVHPHCISCCCMVGLHCSQTACFPFAP